MPPTIFPISSIVYPLKQTLHVDAVKNNFGAGYGQRIVTDFAKSRADGAGNVRSYVGSNKFQFTTGHLPLTASNHPSNANIQNSLTKLLQFFQDRMVKWESFYFYNPKENLVVANWDGTNTTGRYLVTFTDPDFMSEQFRLQLSKVEIQLDETFES